MLLPSFAQVISYAINKCSFQLQELLELCVKCTETFPKVCQILIFLCSNLCLFELRQLRKEI